MVKLPRIGSATLAVQFRRPRSGYAPPLLPIVVPAAFTLTLVGVVVSWVYRFMLGEPFRILPWPVRSPHVSPDDALRNTVAVVGLVAAVLTAVYAYRKQRLAEAESRRMDAMEFSRRYGDALTQLGGATPALRIGGAFAMARLADDWPEQRQTCIDVLCAYLRMPFEPDPASKDFVSGENEVRDSIQRIIQWHVCPWSEGASISWSPHRFNFDGAHLQWADFHGAVFGALSDFRRAKFAGVANFSGARLSSFGGFSDAAFDEAANFTGVFFGDGAFFRRTKFASTAIFHGAVFGRESDFRCAEVGHNLDLSEATFQDGVLFDDVSVGGVVLSRGTTPDVRTLLSDP